MSVREVGELGVSDKVEQALPRHRAWERNPFPINSRKAARILAVATRNAKLEGLLVPGDHWFGEITCPGEMCESSPSERGR